MSDPVSRWIEAHNDRDLDGMLACVAEEVEFRPLRITGGADSLYVGREGLRSWFAELMRNPVRHELRVSELREGDEGEVLAVGSVELSGSSRVADFCGIYEISDGLIARAHHYMSDRKTMEQLGLLGRAES